ncbi:WD40-repeat-containing domain protein [Amanita muscaria]
MPQLSEYEIEREANIARNRALLEELELKKAVEDIVLSKPKAKSTAKPVRAAKRKREKNEQEPPRRQSARLRNVIDPNESPEKRMKREEEQRARDEEERLEAEEQARIARLPRRQSLELSVLLDEASSDEVDALTSQLLNLTHISHPRRVADIDAYTFKDDEHATAEVEELRSKLKSMKIVSRAKVTDDRVYSCAYHPERTKDLIFFGDKHGQLGIWDARAPPEEMEDEDGDVAASENSEGGKSWRLQIHWPATSKSSISSIKFDPVNAHNVYTSSYDQTIRFLSFTTGISQEVFSSDVLIHSIDLDLSGHGMWISDSDGGVTHLDLRQHKSKAKRYIVDNKKIGCISINPTRPNFLLTASNERSLKIWDVRKLQSIVMDVSDAPPTPPASSPSGPNNLATHSPTEFDLETVTKYTKSKRGKGTFRGEWNHDKSVSSAYWDSRGRQIVSTCYDDTLRLWDFESRIFASTGNEAFPTMRPFNRIRHNCQTGKWLTILRAQWSPNPDVYPHFTIGNMNHSLNIFSCRGELITKLHDSERVSAVQAVTASHPSIVERAVSGNGSGRCILWAPQDTEYS